MCASLLEMPMHKENIKELVNTHLEKSYQTVLIIQIYNCKHKKLILDKLYPQIIAPITGELKRPSVPIWK